MTMNLNDDHILGQELRAEVPSPGDDYWDNIARALGIESVAGHQGEAAQPIDADHDATVVSFRSRLGRGFGGAAALAVAAALLVIVGVVVGTRVQRSTNSVETGYSQDPSLVITDPAALDALPGPTKNLDHWNAVYGVWDCTANNGQGDWLPQFDSWEDDVGIHSHDDGLISIHPFFDESAGRNATFSHFVESMNFELTDASITLDDGRTLLEGTKCGDQQAVVHLRRWQSDVTARTEPVLSPRVITEDLNGERFYNDREVWILAFAPLGADIPLPPPERFAHLDTQSVLLGFAPVPDTVDAATMRTLDADIARTLEPPPEPVTYLPSNTPTTVFSELTREPRPEWTETIVEDTFRPMAAANHQSYPGVVLAAYRILLSDETTRACVAAINIEAQEIAGASYCHHQDTTAPSSLLMDQQGPTLFVRNTPIDAAYLVIETIGGTRIVTNPVERHAFVSWDFATYRIAELTFYNSALQPIVTCPRPSEPIEPECLRIADS